ncbi:MAG: PAS domain-containing protein [Myxococcales bacterium]
MSVLIATVLGGLVALVHLVIVPFHVELMAQRTRDLTRVLQVTAPLLAPAQLQRLIVSLQEGEKDIAYLLVVDRDGRALAHSNPARVGKIFGDAGTLSAARDGRSVEQNYVRDSDDPASPFHGQRVVDVLLPIVGPDGRVTGAANAGLSLERVHLVQMRYYGGVAALALVLLTLFGLAWLLLSRGILGPIQLVAQASRHLGEGAFEAQLPVGRSDEVGTLARDFVGMAGRISSLLAALRERERDLQEHIDSLRTFSGRLDTEGRLVMTNATSARAARLSAEEVARKPYFWELPVWEPATAVQVKAGFARALQGETVQFDAALCLVDNRHATLDLSFAPLRDAAGHTTVVVVEGRDVSARRAAEEALRQSEARYRALAEAASDEIFIVDREGVLSYANRAFLERRGISLSAALDRRLQQLWPAALADSVARRVAEVLATREPHRSEERWTWGGAESWRDTVLVPIADAGGAGPFVLGISRDVTELKAMQAKLLVADRMLSIGVLAAGVAHEINNPLSFVQANLALAREALDAGCPPDEASLRETSALLAEAEVGAERVRHIVRDLKTFSRAEDERVAPVDVLGVVEASVRMADNAIRHRARLVKQYAPVPPVAASEARLGQVFLNLLVNAAQAIPEGDADHHTITVRVGPAADGRVEVAVSDTGRGIEPEHLGQLFKPFFTTKPVGEGTGLGLSICQNIVRALGGEIRVESRPGAGTTFRVLLPATARPAEPPRPAPSPPAKGARGSVLIIDDDESVGRSLELIIAREHATARVTDAREALERLGAGERFDVVFCDLMMPRMTGAQFYAQLQTAAPEMCTRVVFMTGGAFSDEASRFLDQVPNLAIEKPFAIAAVLRLLRQRVAELQSRSP